MRDIVLNSIVSALKEHRLDRVRRMWAEGDISDKGDAEFIAEAFAVIQAMQDAGWKPMPVTPTKEMIAAAHSDGHWGSIPEIYRNLVEAAPKVGE